VKTDTNLQRRFRYEHMKAHIGEYKCACTRPGVRVVGRLAVCAVCDRLEQRRELLVAKSKTATKWQQPERQSAAERFWEGRTEEVRLRVVVEETSGEMVVRAHGEYHLKVA
jgi:hypothetical protein